MVVSSGHRPALNERIKVGSKKLSGTCRFVGPTSFSGGEWIGVELDEAVGKNDGSVEGNRYFQCPRGYGIFIKQAQVFACDPEPASPKGRAPAAAPRKKLPTKELSKEKHIHAGGSESLSTTTAGSEVSPRGDSGNPSVAPSAALSQAAHGAAQQEGGEAVTLRDLRDQRVVQQELASAVSRLDVERVKELLPSAEAARVPPEELLAAQRLANAQAQADMCREVEVVRGAVVLLARSVHDVEARAAAVERALALSGAASGDAQAHAAQSGWIKLVARQLRQELWSLLEGQIVDSISRAVQRAVNDLSAEVRASAEAGASSVLEIPTASSNERVVNFSPIAEESSPTAFDEAAVAGATPGEDMSLRMRMSSAAGWAPIHLSESPDADHLGAARQLIKHYALGNTSQAEDMSVRMHMSSACGWAPIYLSEPAEVAEEEPLDPREEKAVVYIQRKSREYAAEKRLRQAEARQLPLPQQQPQEECDLPAEKLRVRYSQQADIFEQATRDEGGPLDRELFFQTVCFMHPSLREEQADAIFNGFTRGMQTEAVDLYGFCMIEQAISAGGGRAAEFADLCVEQYSALGNIS